ncbi:peptidylprolyl isomerase [Aquabacterium sp.]|uniref:peptidylprolyl isomerase n=1 Tax=Aquabacterium sp. TaxID=1872578 RepID=UPI0019AD402D|nr:peptidylprolyl isomerase [Aquabacterium sp.]MBC7698814.1 peptidylprolyl isomerase [Aquabacterium sp.]
MKTFRTHVIKSAVLAATLSLAAPLVMAQNIAIVNGKPVPKARFDAMMTQIVKQGQQAKTPDLEAKVREELVLREIFVQEAEKKGIAATSDYKTQMEFARQSILIQALFTDFQAKSKDSEADLRAEYDKIKAQNGDKEYRARHILVEKEDEAKAIITQLKAGAKFEDLAKKNSKDPGSAENGGDLDWAAPGNYVPEFSEAMSKLEKGKFTETPVKSQFGYHIIKLEDSRATQFPPYDEVKVQLQQRNAQAKLAKYRDDLKAKAKTDFKFSAPAAAN